MAASGSLAARLILALPPHLATDRNWVESGRWRRYALPMARYSEIEDISPCPRSGTIGPDGWGFHLWSGLIDDEAPHRALLEQFASTYPHSVIKLPAYDRNEDFIECDATWNAKPVWIYYETMLSYLWLWSADREAIVSMREALVPLAD